MDEATSTVPRNFSKGKIMDELDADIESAFLANWGRGLFQNAKRSLIASVESKQIDSGGLLRLSEELLQLDSGFEESADLMEELVAMGFDSSGQRILLARAAVRANRYQVAIDECTRALQEGGDEVGCLLQRGVALYLNDQASDSIPDFKRVLALSPDNMLGRLRLILSLTANGKLEEAKRHLYLIVEMKGKDQAKWDSLADVEVYNQLLSSSHIELACQYVDLGETEYDTASRILEQCMEAGITNDDFELLLLIAQRYFGLEKAIEYHKSGQLAGVRLKSTSSLHLSRLASSGEHLEAAETVLAYAVKCDPNDLLCKLELGWILFRQNDLEESETCLRQVVSAEPANAAAVAMLSWVLASFIDRSKRSEADKLAMHLQQLDGYPEQKKLKILAKSKIQTGDATAGVRLVREIQKLAPDENLDELIKLI